MFVCGQRAGNEGPGPGHTLSWVQMIESSEGGIKGRIWLVFL